MLALKMGKMGNAKKSAKGIVVVVSYLPKPKATRALSHEKEKTETDFFSFENYVYVTKC